MVAFSPMEEGIVAASLVDEMIGASDGCRSNVLADEPGIDVIFV